mmetsp:Transcript_21291/g.30839  ORF Transcript_21291/g.30839 Transcript_21291/m.30839 type:complete len:83 (-) Transcript_21291:23-271(-)
MFLLQASRNVMNFFSIQPLGRRLLRLSITVIVMGPIAEYLRLYHENRHFLYNVRASLSHELLTSSVGARKNLLIIRKGKKYL